MPYSQSYLDERRRVKQSRRIFFRWTGLFVTVGVLYSLWVAIGEPWHHLVH